MLGGEEIEHSHRGEGFAHTSLAAADEDDGLIHGISYGCWLGGRRIEGTRRFESTRRRGWGNGDARVA